MIRYTGYKLPHHTDNLSPQPWLYPSLTWPSQPLRFAPATRESRVAMLYTKYLGINGSLFDVKLMGLQLMTVVLQVRHTPRTP